MNETAKLKIVKSEKYLKWITDFTDQTPTRSWDDETAHMQKKTFNQYDMNNVMLFSFFIEYVRDLAQKQYVVSLPHTKFVDFRYDISLNDRYYEVLVTGHGCISVIKEIEYPEGKLIYVDTPIDPKELRDREFIQYILVNKDLDIPTSVFAVHIAHACTICVMKEKDKPAFGVWYNDKQKIIILDAPQEKMEALESVGYTIRDTGHNDIPKNALVALSLGIIPKAKALKITSGCTLHKD